MNYGNVFRSGNKSYPAEIMPVWLSVNERKVSGGSVDVSAIPANSTIKAGSPVYLPKMGDKAIILDTYEVAAAVTASSTIITFKLGKCGSMPYAGSILGKIDATGKAAIAGTIGESKGNGAFTITANALGTLAIGDLLYVIAEAGSEKMAVMPTGLSWHDIHAAEGSYAGTVAVVTKGQILADRIPDVPSIYKGHLGGITFENEL